MSDKKHVLPFSTPPRSRKMPSVQESPQQLSQNTLFKTLLGDPQKRAMVLQFLAGEEDNIEAYRRKQQQKQPEKSHFACESPTALFRRRALESCRGNSPTGSDSSTSTTSSNLPSAVKTKTVVPFNKLLIGVVAYVEIISNGEDKSASAKVLIVSMGAKVRDRLQSDVTHVIFKDGSYKTYDIARRLKVHVVSILWLEAVKRNSGLVPEKDYPAFGTDEFDANVSDICKNLQNDNNDEYRRSIQVGSEQLSQLLNSPANNSRRQTVTTFTPPSRQTVSKLTRNRQMPTPTSQSVTKLQIPKQNTSRLNKTVNLAINFSSSDEETDSVMLAKSRTTMTSNSVTSLKLPKDKENTSSNSSEVDSQSGQIDGETSSKLSENAKVKTPGKNRRTLYNPEENMSIDLSLIRARAKKERRKTMFSVPVLGESTSNIVDMDITECVINKSTSKNASKCLDENSPPKLHRSKISIESTDSINSSLRSSTGSLDITSYTNPRRKSTRFVKTPEEVFKIPQEVKRSNEGARKISVSQELSNLRISTSSLVGKGSSLDVSGGSRSLTSSLRVSDPVALKAKRSSGSNEVMDELSQLRLSTGSNVGTEEGTLSSLFVSLSNVPGSKKRLSSGDEDDMMPTKRRSLEGRKSAENSIGDVEHLKNTSEVVVNKDIQLERSLGTPQRRLTRLNSKLLLQAQTPSESLKTSKTTVDLQADTIDEVRKSKKSSKKTTINTSRPLLNSKTLFDKTDLSDNTQSDNERCKKLPSNVSSSDNSGKKRTRKLYNSDYELDEETVEKICKSHEEDSPPINSKANKKNNKVGRKVVLLRKPSSKPFLLTPLNGKSSLLNDSSSDCESESKNRNTMKKHVRKTKKTLKEPEKKTNDTKVASEIKKVVCSASTSIASTSIASTSIAVPSTSKLSDSLPKEKVSKKISTKSSDTLKSTTLDRATKKLNSSDSVFKTPITKRAPLSKTTPNRKSTRLVTPVNYYQNSQPSEDEEADCTITIKPEINRRSTMDFTASSTSSTPNSSTQSRSSKASPRTTKPGIVCTRFQTSAKVAKFHTTVRKLGGFVVDKEVIQRTTHLVVGEPKRTINVLKAIARGCWIVSAEWLNKSLSAGKWLSEEDFELTDFSVAVKRCRTERQAFGRNYTCDIFSVDNIGEIYIAKLSTPVCSDLQSLVTLCAGSVAKTARSASIVVGEKSRNLPNVKAAVSEQWLLDSVTLGRVQPFKQYLLEPMIGDITSCTPKRRISEDF